MGSKRLQKRASSAGVMIGRGALRTPWIFRRAWELLKTGKVGPEPSFNDKCRTILRHIDLLERYTDEQYGIRTMQQKISRYGKTMGHVKSMKETVRTAESYDQMRRAVRAWILPHREEVTTLARREYHLQAVV